MTLPAFISDAIRHAHPGWHPALQKGMEAVARADGSYLTQLEKDGFLPTQNRLFAAFSLPPESIRHILVGEGPYPREASATGYCFMDGAVGGIWSDKGFSTQVNRATSLRNFLKMLLVAENTLNAQDTGAAAMATVAHIAQGAESSYIRELPQLQQALLDQGFLLLNATLVFRPHVPPMKESRAWQPFLHTVLEALAENAAASGRELPLLILWGKVAERLADIAVVSRFPQARSEHPYNLSFIRHAGMQALFGPMRLFRK